MTSFQIRAQVISSSTYPASTATGVSLESMTGALNLLNSNVDEAASSLTNIGFDFYFKGTRYTQFSVIENGLMRLGGTSITPTFNNTLASTTNNPKIAPYFDDLHTGSNGNVRYVLNGSAPSRKLVVEWNVRLYSLESGNFTRTFQVVLNETSNKIDFIYGSGLSSSPSPSYTIGIGSSDTEFASITNSSLSVSYSNSDNSQSSATTSGRRFSFTPSAQAASATSFNANALSNSQIDLSWTDASNELGYELYYSTNSIVPLDASSSTRISLSQNSSSYSVTGLSAGTTYYFKLFSTREALSTAATANATTCNAGTASATVSSIECSGTTQLSLTGYSGSLQWQSSSDNSSWSNIAGATSTPYTNASITANTYFRAVVTNGSCIALSNVLTINYSPTSGTASGPSPSTISSGTTAALTLTGSSGSIQWQQSADGSTGWANVSGGSGATSANYTSASLSATTYYRSRLIGGACTTYTNVVKITVVSGVNIWKGTNSSAWTTSSNWSTGSVPTSSSNVIIPSDPVNNPTISDGSNVNVADLTIAEGAILNLTVTSSSLNIYGNFANNGTLNHTGTVYLYFQGSSKTISGTGNFFGGTICPFRFVNGSSYTFGSLSSSSIRLTHLYIDYQNSGNQGNLSIGANKLSTHFFIQEGTFSMSTGTLEIAGPTSWTMNYGKYNGITWANPGAGTTNPYFVSSRLSLGTGSVNYNSGDYIDTDMFKENDQTVKSLTYPNLKVRTNNGKTASLGSAIIVTGNLEFINQGTSGGIATTTGDITLNGNLIFGTTGNGCTLNLGHRIARSSGTGAGTLTMGDNDSHLINLTYVSSSNTAVDLGAGGATTNLTFAGLVKYNSSSVTKQIIIPSVYKHIEITGIGSGLRELSGNTTVNGNLSITITGTGYLDAKDLFNYNLTLGGHWINTGTSTSSPFLGRNGTVILNGSSTQYINVSNTTPTKSNVYFRFNNLMISGSDVRFYSNDNYGADVMNDLTVNSGAKMTNYNPYSTGLVNIDYWGNIINNGTIDESNSGWDYYVNNPKSISGTGSFVNTWLWGKGATSITDNFEFTRVYVTTSNSVIISANKLVTISKYSGIGGHFTNNGTTTLNTGSGMSLQGNFTNNSTLTANSSSTVTFNGSAAQNCKSNGASLGNVILNNSVAPSASNGVVLTDNLTIASTLTLTDGSFITGANRVILNSTAASSLTAGAGNSNYTESFVFGNLRRNVASNTSTYDFPMGTATSGRLAKLKNANLSGGGFTYLDASFSSSYSNTGSLDPTKAHDNNVPFVSVNTAGIWQIDANNQPASGSYNMYLYLNGFSGLTDNQFALLKRSSASGSASDWSGQPSGSIESADGDGRTLSYGYALRKGMTSFSHFGVGQSATPLPVNLLSFNAEAIANTVKLSWSTNAEINNDYFTIERSSDGRNFEALEYIQGAGNSNEVLNYNTIDPSPYVGISYYRLKQTDFDGTMKIYTIVPVNINASGSGTKLYPNPATSFVILSLPEVLDDASTIRVFDPYGKLILTQNAFTGSSNYSIIDLSDFSSGVYVIQLESGAKFESFKFVKN